LGDQDTLSQDIGMAISEALGKGDLTERDLFSGNKLEEVIRSATPEYILEASPAFASTIGY